MRKVTISTFIPFIMIFLLSVIVGALSIVGTEIIFPASTSASESQNDPCNYHGLNICDSSGKCDKEEFDCYTDDCVNGEAGITGQCDGDDDDVYCWDSQQDGRECTSTLLIINLSNSNVLNNTYSSFDTSNGIVISKNDNFSTFVTSFSSPVIGCDYVDEKIYSLNNTTLPGGHFIRYAAGQLKSYDETSLSNSIITPVWAGGIPAGCIKYILFDLNERELYFFGDAFKNQGSRILSDTESNELVKMSKDLFTLDTTTPEFVASPCLDYCRGTSFTKFENQTYWTWGAPESILYPRPSDDQLETYTPEIFQKVDTVANKLIEFCRCAK